MSKKEIFIIGSGGHSRVVIDTFNNKNFIIKGIIDLNYSKLKSENEKILGFPVVGNVDYLKDINDEKVSIFFAVGDNKLRKKISSESIFKKFSHPSVVGKNTIVSEFTKIGIGTYIASGSIINSEVNIGNYCIINTGSIIEHEVSIGDFSHVGPGSKVAGRVQIGSNVLIGIGVSIKNDVKIGNNVTIGAGSVVINNIENNSKVAGVPAKDI